MGDAGLVDLARRFVELSDELETVRGEIKRAVLNGAREIALSRPPSGRGQPERRRKRPRRRLSRCSRTSRISERQRSRRRRAPRSTRRRSG